MADTRRTSPRLHESCALLARSIGRIKNEGLHRTTELGLRGCSFESRTPYGLGTKLKLALSLEGRVVGLEGAVVREIGSTSEGFTVGVKFTNVVGDAKEMLESLFALEKFAHREEEEFATLTIDAAG